jgi:hypothetical protein
MCIPLIEGYCYGPKLITALKTSHIENICAFCGRPRRFLGLLKAGSRELFELRYAPYLSNSWNLQAIYLSPLGGRGQGEGGMLILTLVSEKLFYKA